MDKYKNYTAIYKHIFIWKPYTRPNWELVLISYGSVNARQEVFYKITLDSINFHNRLSEGFGAMGKGKGIDSDAGWTTKSHDCGC